MGGAAGGSYCSDGGGDDHRFQPNLSVLLGRSRGPDFLARVEQAALSLEGILDAREQRAGICRAGCRSRRHAFGAAGGPIGRGGTSRRRNGASPGPSRNGRTLFR